MIAMDAEGRVVKIDPAAEALFGQRRQDLLCRDMADFMIPERYRAAHRVGLTRYRDNEQSSMLGARLELSSLHASGAEFPVVLSVSAINEGGVPGLNKPLAPDDVLAFVARLRSEEGTSSSRNVVDVRNQYTQNAIRLTLRIRAWLEILS